MIRFVVPKDVRLSQKWKLLSIFLGGSVGIVAAIEYLTR